MTAPNQRQLVSACRSYLDQQQMADQNVAWAFGEESPTGGRWVFAHVHGNTMACLVLAFPQRPLPVSQITLDRWTNAGANTALVRNVADLMALVAASRPRKRGRPPKRKATV